MRGNRTVGGCPNGGGGGETKSPKERYNLIFLKHFYRAEQLPVQSSADPNLRVPPLLTSLSNYYEKRQKNPGLME